MSERILMAWVGSADLRAVDDEAGSGAGPIGQAVAAREYARVVLLSNYPEPQTTTYVAWLRGRTRAAVECEAVALSSPTDYAEVHAAVVAAVGRVLAGPGARPALTFHLSPGTPAMAAIWIILSKTRFPAELIESSREHGVKVARVPFEMSAEFIPDLLRGADERLERLSAGLPPEAPEFEQIVHRSPVMKRLVAMARRVAPRSVPVLIEGESGTGKELLARAIHRSSPRRDHSFVAANCGAIPSELIESELFGHEKGAFTGAHQARKGYFESAHGGTLFLDEVGELPANAQVKLLRVLQEGEVVRVGASLPVKVDVRIVAATNRTLASEIAAGRFREDLFYRLAVAVLQVPPLAKRTGDIGLLIDHLLAVVNDESREDPGFTPKRLSSGARELMLAHPWPGNVRELGNTLRRAVLWTVGDTIRVEDMRDALLPPPGAPTGGLLDRPLGGDFRLADLIGEVARHYLRRALEQSHGNKSRAAELVGLPSYQTFTNWMERHGVETPGRE